MKKIFLYIVFIFIASSVDAVPVKNESKTIKLADGTTVTATLVGDEYGHWYIDENNRPFIVDDNGITYLSEKKLADIKSNAALKMAQVNTRRMSRLSIPQHIIGSNTINSTHHTRGITDEMHPLYGERKGLVILANYKDVKMSNKNAAEIFDNMFNKIGYNDNHHIGSVHDYFHDQSYGAFDLSFDIVGPVELTKDMAYYGKNDNWGNDTHPCELVGEIISLAYRNGVDFSPYDWDGDGEVDQILIIYAGYGENITGSDPNTIWPHEYTLDDGAKELHDGPGSFIVGNVRVNTYAITCELDDTRGTTLAGIGTACHEFSHCLGFPDTYDTSYTPGTVGMDNWDLMANGNYNGPNRNGQVPAGYTSYERWMAGWLSPIVLSEPCHISEMKPLTQDADAYIIYNDANNDEMFLLENHQGEVWDSYITGDNGKGLLLIHIDYDKYAWKTQDINTTPSHPRMSYVAADNSHKKGLSEHAGDLFPGTTGNNSFTDSSTPSAKVYNMNTEGKYFLSKPITDIESKDGLISFNFMGGTSAIQQIEKDSDYRKKDSRIYNIYGQRTNYNQNNIPAGIYISNKKKIVVNH